MKSLTPQINLWTVMSKQLTLSGSLLKPQPIEIKERIAEEVKEKVWPLLASGQVKPYIYKVFKLEDAGKAHQLMESSDHIGKIILENSAS
jgi:NADPH:quinone reductase-like Zn-dependent oxidoreductase